ncbi:MAG TPA: ribonuclease R [Steroidobacteraceae bacterium]|nr:ribonuclease R [Steroidobacteraceae bacterium]
MRRTRNRRKTESGPRPAKTKRARATVRLAHSADLAVLNVLRKAGRPLRLEEVTATFSRSGAAQAQEQLADLVRRGEVVLNRRGQYCLREQLSGLTVGTVQGHRNGDGWLLPDDGSAQVYLPAHQMREVLHGDRIAARIDGPRFRGKAQGTLVEVLERRTREVVGRLQVEAGIAAYVTPDNPRITHRVLIPSGQLGGAVSGQIVLVELVQQPSRTTGPVGRVAQILGDHGAPGMETEIAIHSYGLPHEFPDEVVAEAEAYGAAIPLEAIRGREDLRDIELVTIDGEDARDFDDAVWCERKGTGWRLVVAIADVAHYVQPGSPLDVEARERGTSVYFPNRVLPMLPEALSNGLCSLKPHEDRLCVCCELRVTDDGRITRSRFFEGVMRSAARLTYREVGAFLDKPGARPDAKLEPLRERLLALHGVYKAFTRARSGRGALELDTPELKLKFDEQGRVAALVEYPRNDAHRLIEECMIAANVAAARFLDRHRVPTLYRVHGLPEVDRLETLRTFLREFGLWLPPAEEVTPEHLRDLLSKIGDRPDAGLVSTAVIRSMPQAVYQPGNIGHFGLALEHYAHFTSPIRRYPDLVVHRGIRQVLRGGDPQELVAWHGAFPQLGQDCSFRERRADEATRSAVAWLKCYYMQDRIGEEYDGIVSGVVDFGLFVQLDGLQVDGLLHVSALGADYFGRDASGFRMIGRSSGKVFKLGDRVRVRVTNVSLDDRRVDFELAGVMQAERRPSGRFLRQGGRRRRG